MPVKEFTGKLDQPKVREFTGQLDQAMRDARGAAMSHAARPGEVFDRTQAAGPPEMAGLSDTQFDRNTEAGNAEVLSHSEDEVPFVYKHSTSRAALPVLGGAVGAMSGPPGWLGLLTSSLTAGGLAATGEMIAQKVNREEVDPKAALSEGVATGAGNLVGGGVLKSLGGAAKKLFHSPLNESQQTGAEFARGNKVPFPLSSAAPGSRAGFIQQGSRTGLLGELRTQADANKVAQFLNSKVSTMHVDASPIDEAASKGQQYLREVFEPGETAYKETFGKLKEVIGENTAIPLTNTAKALHGTAEALKTRGATGAVAQQIMTIAKRNPTVLTAQQVDDLYGELLKKAGKNPTVLREMNAVLDGLAKDSDEVAKQFGVTFYDDLNAAKGVRDSYRELRKIPSLQKLSEDIGSPRGAKGTQLWMSELFGSPNGKALGELRNRNPELYHELADSWLANNISKFSMPTDTGIGRALDGVKLREWYKQNANQIKLIFGAPQAKALDNFTNYAELMSGSVRRANQGSSFTPTNMMGRISGTAAGMKFAPFIMAPTEGGSFLLARGLSDPNSGLFKLFTQGVDPKTLDFMRVSAALSGQGAGSAFNER